MIEASASLAISFALFLYGYGKLVERINNLKLENDSIKKELDVVMDMRIAIAHIQKDVEHIKNKIDNE